MCRTLCNKREAWAHFVPYGGLPAKQISGTYLSTPDSTVAENLMVTLSSVNFLLLVSI
jgi:hypothetical protein